MMDARDLIDPTDSPQRRLDKMIRINSALMRRVEQPGGVAPSSSFEQFQRAVMLEEEVRERTADLEETLRLLNTSNAQLARATKDAQDARADLANALEAMQEGFALFSPDGALVMCNTRFCKEMPDLQQRLKTGLSFDDYVSMVSESPELALTEAERPAWRQERHSLHRQPSARFNMRFRSGVWLQVSEEKTKDGGSAIIQTDITEMIRVERAERERQLDDQARLVRATLDHMDEGVAVFDAEGQLAGWNNRLGELLAPPMRVVRLGVRFDVLFEAVARDLEFDLISAGSVRDWVKYGSERPPLRFEVSRAGRILKVYAQEMPDGGFVMSFADVSAERTAMDLLSEANERLEQRVTERTEELNAALGTARRANATKSRFVAAASHDIQQPISAAKHFIAALSRASDPDLIREAGQDALNALSSVEDILDDLLAISMLDAGGKQPKFERASVGRLFDQLHSEFRVAAEEAGLRLCFRPTNVQVRTDPAYLRRILRNLVSNAIRYTETGGVLIGARHRSGRVVIQVIDTGIGIKDDDQAAVFQEFTRLSGPVSAAAGLGLGLAIVERACQFLGHDLRLSSTPGRGSVFEIGFDAPTDTEMVEDA